MVRIKNKVPLFLVVFDLLFQMQEKSRLQEKSRKKGRHALVDFVQLLGGACFGLVSVFGWSVFDWVSL